MAHDEGVVVVGGQKGELVKNPLHQVVRDNAVLLRSFARELGLTAGSLVREAAGRLGGGGGGRDDVAQGGGAPLGDRTPAAIDEAFDAVRAVVRDMVGAGGVA